MPVVCERLTYKPINFTFYKYKALPHYPIASQSVLVIKRYLKPNQTQGCTSAYPTYYKYPCRALPVRSGWALAFCSILIPYFIRFTSGLFKNRNMGLLRSLSSFHVVLSSLYFPREILW
jgi:hypothetical protein